jgi:thiol-disulfide isomerase/thioredoxin
MNTKRVIIITAAVIASALCAVFVATRGGSETVIVQPEFDDNTDYNHFSLYKIERTDAATIVHADVYNLPNYWVSYSSGIKLKDSHGKLYKLLKCTGFELDKRVFMPASGSMSFALYFEPVDQGEDVVDIIDMDDSKATITGVKLYNVRHDEPVECLLKGEVINRPQSSRMALLRDGEDFRVAKVTYVPVHEGKFEYMLYADAEEAYQLIFVDELNRGYWFPVVFIAESGTCYFTLNNEEGQSKNSIRGGKYAESYFSVTDGLNKTMAPHREALEKKQRELEEDKMYYIPEVYDIIEQTRHLSAEDPKREVLFSRYNELKNSGKDKTREGQEVEDGYFQIYKTMYTDKLLEYAKEHADITGYTFLVDRVRNAIQRHRELDATPMFAVFHDVYEKKFPAHPYTVTLRSYMQAAAIAVGNPCPDVVTEDVDGKEVHLSELIKGKVALVHLWASWCGPCRQHGMEMIPVYEMYKEKGFTVVSIANERKKESMIAAANMDKYPWANYLELNGKNGIWTTFGVGNGGGGEFLVDARGNFLAVNASAKEMVQILQGLFE